MYIHYFMSCVISILSCLRLITLSYSILGKIIPPPDGTVLTFLPGSSGNITWDFDDEISKVATRSWTFTSSDGLRSGTLGIIGFNSQPQIRKDVLSGVDIIKPATLELNNVDNSFDGIYKFSLTATESDTSNVILYIASKFHC